MRYDLKVGKYILGIEDDLNLIDLDFYFFKPVDISYEFDALCRIQRYDENLDIPKSFLKMKGKLIEGSIRGKYYSVLVSRKIVIVTDIMNKRIDVYVEDNSINIMSVYSFYVCLKKHIIKIFSDKENIALHASAIFDGEAGKAHLIMGHSNGGKSSLSWQLLKYNQQLISDDITYINGKTGRISGGGGYLYVTDDFVTRFGVDNYQVVSPGRKVRVAVNEIDKAEIDIDTIIIAAGVSERESYQITDHDRCYEELLDLQKGWIAYNNDQVACNDIIQYLSIREKSIHKIYLNNCTKQYLDKIFIKKSKKYSD